MSIKKVIENDFCVGCGACCIIDEDNTTMKLSKDGFYKVSLQGDIKNDASHVCPFSDHSENETIISKKIYSTDCSNYDDRVGFYSKIITGNVRDFNSRLNSSSGGLTSWITEKLILTNQVEAVVHVGFDGNSFKYLVSRSVEEIRNKNNKKSRYYPVTYNDVLEYLKNTHEKVAFIGIPCFVKSIRLIQNMGHLKNVKFCISLLCGHMKSSGFAESLAWQLGIKPKNLKRVDFRVKKKGYLASDYFFEAEDLAKNVTQSLSSELLGTNWGQCFFKNRACDFCDDIAGETADITLGDAWLTKYTKNYLGTNIAVIRDKRIEKILEEFKSELNVEDVSVDTFFETQAGNYRNRRGGIIIRKETSKRWTPSKRINLCKKYSGDPKKNKIYLYRTTLAQKSITNFNLAKWVGSITLFKVLMLPYLLKYEYLNYGIKGLIKTFIPKKIKKSLKTILKAGDLPSS